MEKVPRKKEKRPVKKGPLLLILLGAGLLIGTGAYFLRPRTELPSFPDSPAPAVLLSRPQEEIAYLDIAPREGEAYRVLWTEGAAALDGREKIPLQTDLTDEMLRMAATVTAETTVWENTDIEGVAAFGLHDPQLTLTVGYTDGENKKLFLGDLAPEERPQRYAAVEGDPRLYTVLEADCEIFFHDRDYLRAFDQPKVDASLLDRIEIAGDVTLDMRYTPSGWEMDAPFSYPAAPARVSALLTQISAMAFESCLGDRAELQLSDYGLEEPALKITLTQAPTVIEGETAEGEQVRLNVPQTAYTLWVGAETGKSGVYILWRDQVFRASNFLLGFWKTIRAEDLLLQQPVNFLVNDLTYVSFSLGDIRGAYRVAMVESVTDNNLIATDEYGRTLYECEVTGDGDGKAVDQAAFLNWYTALASLKGTGRLPADYAVTGDAEAEIILRSNSIVRTVAFYPYDALHCALAVNGTALYYTPRDWLDRVRILP